MRWEVQGACTGLLLCAARQGLARILVGGWSAARPACLQTAPSLCSPCPPGPPQLTLLPEEEPSHQQHELWLGDAYARGGRYREAARQYRQLLDHAAEDAGHLPEPRVEVLARLADIQVGPRSWLEPGWLAAEPPCCPTRCKCGWVARAPAWHGRSVGQPREPMRAPLVPAPSTFPRPQLKLDEAAAVEEVEARMQAATAAAAAGPDAAPRAGSAPGSPAAQRPSLSGRTVSNLQLEVLSAQALADEAGAEGGGGEPGTAQTLLELCCSEYPFPRS